MSHESEPGSWMRACIELNRAWFERYVAWRTGARRLELTRDAAILRDQRRAILRFAPDAVQRIYAAGSGSDIFATDFEFEVVVLDDAVLVLPGDCGLLRPGLPPAWTARLNAAPLIHRVAMDAPPWRWRLVSLSPLTPVAVKLRVDSRAALRRYERAWQYFGEPLTLNDFLRG